MRRCVIATVLLAAFVCCHAGMSLAGDTHELVQQVPGGLINWTGLFVEARGFGTTPPAKSNTATGWETALRLAERDAYTGLVKAFKQLRLSGHWRVKDIVDKNDQMLAKIERLMQSAAVSDIIYSSDGTVEVVRRMPLPGALSQLILPEYIVQLEMKNLGGRLSAELDNEAFTGLVIDARGVNLEPSMCFEVYDETGREVYGPAYVSREFVVQKGMCSYFTDMAAVEESRRAGPRPLVVKALKAQPPAGTQLVISNTDASRLRSTVDHLFFLRRCRVIVVGHPFQEKNEAGP
ncbi:MAG: hypothetical protein K9J85_00285 [Desulfobacteraceae bacterium]|nr:hypothetical protein [Desulfobacteraceae bacterium]